MVYLKVFKLHKKICMTIKNTNKFVKTIWFFSEKKRTRKKIFGDIYFKVILNILFIKSKNKMLINSYVSIFQRLFFGLLKDFLLFLELRGTGFKFELQDSFLLLRLGFSHLVNIKILSGINLIILKTNLIILKSFDLQFLTKFCSQIKRFKALDSYKGKGICYKGTILILKEGKKTQQ